MTEPVTVLICSMIEANQVARMRAVDPRVEVVYEPDLLPVPQYPADHNGRQRELTAAQLARWRGLLAAADVTVDFDWLSPADLRTSSPRLRWVQATSSGIGEFVRRHGLADSGITFTTAAGVHAVPLAEFAVAGVLHFVKELPELRQAQQERRWQRRASRLFAGRRVTVVGLGAVGREVARSFAALRAEVTGVGRDGRDRGLGPGIRTAAIAELDQVLTGTDVLVLCTPLTPQTHHLLDRRRLSLLPPQAIVVNLSRGDVIEEPALVEALRSGGIGAACLDVFSTEPLPAVSPLWELDNVVVSPHSASTVDAENRLITDLFCANLENWLAGRPLTNVFRADRGY